MAQISRTTKPLNFERYWTHNFGNGPFTCRCVKWKNSIELNITMVVTAKHYIPYSNMLYNVNKHHTKLIILYTIHKELGCINLH